MSVVIRGMKMPKDCTECRFAFDGRCFANWGRKSKIDVTNYCPLIELPPHGRLIDVSELEKRLFDYGTGTTLPIDWSDIANAQTVIEEKVQKWIPVTERLPDSGVNVLVCCQIKWVGGGGKFYVCDAFYTAPKSKAYWGDADDIDLEYDEDDDEYYLPEGWWEVIKNWDDYGFVAIDDFVTHWMPLPEPPKEVSE